MTTPRPRPTAAVVLVIAAAVATGTMSALGRGTATAAPTCPDQRFVLVGYSQGADVVDNAIGISSVGPRWAVRSSPRCRRSSRRESRRSCCSAIRFVASARK
ncbi:cutinase family protein [Nocardia fluminea]|uniref:cutinase family protein n=1 Tax=Nocardia fluminea TaxID=134984 RepID=UPI0033E5D68A